MSDTGLVLVHGGLHGGDSWRPTVSHLRATAPDLRVLAVDLPGRGRTPGDLGSLTIGSCIESVLAQIRSAGLDRVVLVGHSLAGITIPGVAASLGPQRVDRIVYLACCVPAPDATVVDAIGGPLRWVARRRMRRGGVAPVIPDTLARWAFCNGMTKSQQTFALDSLCADSANVLREPVNRSPSQIPSTWIMTTRDRALSPRRQRTFIANLGGVDEVLPLDACHDAMIERPVELGDILLELVSRTWSNEPRPRSRGSS